MIFIMIFSTSNLSFPMWEAYIIGFSENHFLCSSSCVDDHILLLVSSINILLTVRGPRTAMCVHVTQGQHLVAVAVLKDKWSRSCVGSVKIVLPAEKRSYAASRFYSSFIVMLPYNLCQRSLCISGGCVSTSVKQMLFLQNAPIALRLMAHCWL